MKRKLIVILVAMLAISVGLWAAVEGEGTEPTVSYVGTGAETTVSLDLTASKATLWFTEGAAGTVAGSNLSEYALALLPNADLPMKTTENEVHGGGSTLYLNWNIISAEELGVYLSISDYMKSSDAENTDVLGWNVSWGTSSKIGKSSSVTLAGEGLVFTKTTDTYGNAGSTLLTVLTENAYGLKPDKYEAILTATVKTKD